MKYDLIELHKLKEEGWLEVQYHDSLPLSIWNYSRKTQYEKFWNEITLSCRGLILDNEGNVVARGFSKFHNIEELDPKDIPNEPFEVFEKMDGSLGILFYYNNDWHLATRGSFYSDQAIKGKEILQKYKYKYLPTDCTYLFEIIYPENRIVVNYGDQEKLVLLASIQNNTGEEYCIYNEGYEELGFPLVPQYSISDYNKLKNIVKDNHEGFVIRFKSGFRMKIKGEEYVRLHKLMTGISAKDIWELLKNGEDVSKILNNLPDEMDQWVKDIVRSLKYNYYQINEDAGKTFDYEMYGKYNDKTPITNKKKFAEWVKTQRSHLQPILFRMFDKKDYSDIIWKYIKPKGKPFWQKDVEN